VLYKLHELKFCCRLLFLLVLVTAQGLVHAQPVQFAENKGQWNSNVLFAADAGITGFFLQKQGYRVLLSDSGDMRQVQALFGGHPHVAHGTPVNKKSFGEAATATEEKNTAPGVILHSHAYEVTFTGASANPEILPDKPIPSYNNYFVGADSSKWASRCRIFQAVLYKNIYPGIDVRYYTAGNQLKYDIIVNPGADISRVAMQFTGADALGVNNGNLVVKTSVGNVTELSPVAYQVINGARTAVEAKFSVSGNTD
jgi:hypothetical protein